MDKLKKNVFLAMSVLGVMLISSCSETKLTSNDSADDGSKKGNDLSFAANSSTAQSIMIDIQGAGDYITLGNDINEVWHFDQNIGATYFTASGGSLNQQKSALKNVAQNQRCTFWDGGTLVGGTQGPVTVTPVSNDPVASRTCWYLQSSTGDGTSGENVNVCVNITIAGESFVFNKKQYGELGKYSFTLKDNLGYSRVSDLQVTLSGDASQTDLPNHSIIEGNDIDGNCGLSFDYYENGGKFGNAKSYLKDGTFGYILTHDGFANNDAGCGTTSIAKVDQLCYSLGTGSYTIIVTAKVKGNSGDFSSDINVIGTTTIHISAEGCQ